MTWNTEPMVTSSALIGVFSGSRIRRSGLKVGSWPGPLGPPFQKVCDRLFCGIGPSEPATCSTSGTANRPSAPPRVYLIIGRRVICELPPPSVSSSTTRSRDSSVARSGWRSSTTSSSGIRVLAQCTAPKPMPSRPSAMVTPRAKLDALVSPMPGTKTVVSRLIAK